MLSSTVTPYQTIITRGTTMKIIAQSMNGTASALFLFIAGPPYSARSECFLSTSAEASLLCMT